MLKENPGKSFLHRSIVELNTVRSEHFSPVRLFIIIIASIFIAEIFAMILVYVIPPLSYVMTTLIDAGSMVILIFPILYLFSFRPLILHIERLRAAEKSLQQKEELKERFFDSIDTLIAYMDSEFNFIRVNDVFAKEAGQLPEYFVGKNYFAIFPHPENQKIFQQVVKTGAAYAANEMSFEFPDQPERGITYWNWSLQPVLGPERNVDGLVLSQVDVTERKRAEEQVRLLSSVVEQTADTVVVTNCDGIIEYINPAFEILTGYSKEEAIGQTPRLLKSGVHDNEFYQKLWGTVLNGQVFHSEMTNRKKNGEVFHEVKTITPLRDEHGKITRFVATGKDITERRQAEENLRKAFDDLEIRVQERTEELRNANSELEDEINVRRGAEEALQKSEQRLNRAQEIAHLGSWELDLVHDQLTWSDEVYRIFGLQPQEFGATYEAFLEAVHPDDRIAVDQAYSGSIRDGRDTYEIEHRVVRRGTGEVRIVHEKCEHFRNAAGQIIRSGGMVHDITERKQAEEQLERTNQKLNEILSSIQDDFYVLDRNWNFVYANRLFAQKIGKEPEDFIGDNIWTMFPKHVGTVFEENLHAAMESREVRRFEISGRYTNAWYRMTAFPSAEGITVLGTDITKRKQAEEALRTSEEKFRRAFADAAIGFALTTPDGHFLEANFAYCLLSGCNLDELQAMKFSDLIHPEDRDENMRLIERMLAGEMADFVIENRYRRKDGRDVWVRKSVSMVRSADGSPQWIIALVEDISERKQAEEALRLAKDELELRVRERTEELAAANRELSNEVAERREIERQLRVQTAAMDAAANGILITDSKGIILWTNSAVYQISGYAYQDLIGQSTRIFNSGKHDAEFYHQMWEAILAGKVWHGEITNRREDGTLYIEEQTITPVRNEEGEISHFIAIKQDVTERNLIYAQLEESNRELTTLSVLERQQRFLAEGLVESSIVLNMSLELDAVLDHIFEQTRRTIPYLMADIVLIESGVANVVRQWGAEDYSEVQTIFKNDSLQLRDFPIWERICGTKSPVMIPDTSLAEQWSHYFGMKWIRSYLGAPLIYGDQVIGIINLCSDQPNAFQEEMAQNLRAFAAPAAMAIQNARLYENEHQNRKIAEILSAASVALAKTLDIQMVMETILDYVQFIMPCGVAFVILSEGDERYRIRAIRASGDTTAIQESLQDQVIDMLSEPLVSAYIQKSESTFIPDTRQVEGWNPPVVLSSMNCWLGIPLESMGKTIGIVVVGHEIPNTFTRNQIQLMEAVVKQAVVALQNAWLFEQVRSGRERLQQLSRHLVEIQENERKYIARELHDETSQSLTSLKLGLQVIQQKVDGQKQLLKQIINLKILADETLESLHRLAVDLRPASLDHLGLVDALTGLIESTKKRSGLIAHFKVMGSMQDTLLNEELETSIYRIVQESLTNVIRHAHAAHVDVILEWQSDKIVIIIEDDGVGIDMEKAKETGHLGLIGMQERAEMLGGKLVVDSAPQVGTTLVVEIPYAHSNTYSR